jgi:SAM-dependent methyltransferase
MSPARLPSIAAYDGFAWFYDRHWAAIFSEKAVWAVDTLLLPYIPVRGRVLDVCCGTGQLAAELGRRGYRVSGIDRSGDMLAYARRRARTANLVRADARAFAFRPVHDAAVSLFDSLNHILGAEHLARTLGNIRDALRDRGWFLFDVNAEAGFRARWVSGYEVVTRTGVCRLAGEYDRAKRIGRYRVTLEGRGADVWRRADFDLVQQCYTDEEIRWALASAGFGDVESHDAETDLDMPEEVGRVFYLARAV